MKSHSDSKGVELIRTPYIPFHAQIACAMQIELMILDPFGVSVSFDTKSITCCIVHLMRGNITQNSKVHMILLDL